MTRPMTHPIHTIAKRISRDSPDDVIFHVPADQLQDSIWLLQDRPVAHPVWRRVSSDPRAVCVLTTPEADGLRRIKVWWRGDVPGDGTGVEPATSG